MNRLHVYTLFCVALAIRVHGKIVDMESENEMEMDDVDYSCGVDHPCRPHEECCGRVFGEPMCLKRPGPGEMCDPVAIDGCLQAEEEKDSPNFCDCPCAEGYICEEARDGTSLAGRPIGYCKKGGIHVTIRQHQEVLDGLLGRGNDEGEDVDDEGGHVDNITL